MNTCSVFESASLHLLPWGHSSVITFLKKLPLTPPGWDKCPGRAGWGCAWLSVEQQGGECDWNRGREGGYLERRFLLLEPGCGGPSVFGSSWSLSWMEWEVIGRLGAKVCLVTQLCSTPLRPHGLLPARLLCPWGLDSPGKNTRVGCHALL